MLLKNLLYGPTCLNFRIFRFLKNFKILLAIFDRFKGIHILQYCQNTASQKPLPIKKIEYLE